MDGCPARQCNASSIDRHTLHTRLEASSLIFPHNLNTLLTSTIPRFCCSPHRVHPTGHDILWRPHRWFGIQPGIFRGIPRWTQCGSFVLWISFFIVSHPSRFAYCLGRLSLSKAHPARQRGPLQISRATSSATGRNTAASSRLCLRLVVLSERSRTVSRMPASVDHAFLFAPASLAPCAVAHLAAPGFAISSWSFRLSPSVEARIRNQGKGKCRIFRQL